MKKIIQYSNQSIHRRIVVVTAAVTLLISTAAQAGLPWMHGGNWGQDQGAPGHILYPAGITNTLTIAQAIDIADALADDYQAVNLNTVRYPFDPATVFDFRAWPITTNVINELVRRGLNIDLLCLYCDQNTTNSTYLQITNYFLWKKAWTNVNNLYKFNANVYYEPINEPHGYTAVNVSNLVYEPFLELANEKNPDHIILDPVPGGADSIGYMSRFASCLIACHEYAGVGKSYTQEVTQITTDVGGYWSRVVFNEVGAATGTGANYMDSSSGNSNVVFLEAVSDLTSQHGVGWAWYTTHIFGTHWDRMFNGYPGGSGSYILNRSLIDYLQGTLNHYTTLYTPGCDFNNIGQTDYSYYRPDLHSFGIQSGGGGPFGSAGDYAVPADYNGTGKVQMATWNPNTHYWSIYPTPNKIQYGQDNDIPVPGDYRGIGSAQVAVWRPSSGTWIVNGTSDVVLGVNGDIPVPGYYFNNGHTDYAVYRPSDSTWRFLTQPTVQFGQSGDVPVPGDYLGNGTTQIAVYHPSDSTWHFYSPNGTTVIQLGNVGDIPVPGDYTGTGGFTHMATWSPTTFQWDVDGVGTTNWGATGFIPLPLPYAIRNACYGYTE